MRLVCTFLFLTLLLSGCARTTDASAKATPEPIVGSRLDAPAPTPTSRPEEGLGAGAIPATQPTPIDPAELAKMGLDAPPPVQREGFKPVTFELLASFPFEVDSQGRITTGEVLPEEIKKLDGQSVAVSGYLIPLTFEGEQVARAVLVRNQLLCCYGQAPAPNEWIYIEARPPIEAVTEVPVTLYGWLEAAPDYEEGQFISLYRMGVSAMAKASM